MIPCDKCVFFQNDKCLFGRLDKFIARNEVKDNSGRFY